MEDLKKHRRLIVENGSYLPTPKAMLHLPLEKEADDIFGGSVKALVFELALVFQSATSHLLILHLLPEVFEWQTGGHHLIDAAAQRPPVHRHAVRLLLQNLRSHVAGRSSLATHRGEKEGVHPLIYYLCSA